MIRLSLPNIITIGLAGMLGYGVLVGGQKLYAMLKGQQATG